MSGIAIGISGIIALVVLLAIRTPVAIALITVSFLGLTILLDTNAAWSILNTVPYEFSASWTLSAVPMFLMMGYISFKSKMTGSLFDVAKSLFSWMPGSLAISSVFACTGFASVCGSSIATAAAMGRISIPEMVRGGYNANIACGAVAAGGTIGALIPPSIILIIYGIFAQTSVLDLFVGGIGVGLLTAACYIGAILAMAALRPDLIPRRLEKVDIPPLGASLREAAPVLILILIIFGGLFSGVFTATEAGAVGAVAAIAIGAATRKITFRDVVESLVETGMTCAGLFIIAIGATMLTRFLAISGTGSFILSLVDGFQLGYWELMLAIILVYLVLGMFMDPIGCLLLTLPIFLPIAKVYDLDSIWFGVLVAKLLEIGMITPPFGLNVFVIRGLVGRLTSLTGIFKGVVPFLAADLVVILLMIAVPGIVTIWQ
ncbi:TRAP transporter large permease [Aminobacter sp. J44]|uniref:TRAP transporter large permease n=1 Tax=Aminobacter sp. J44 TaxID=935262 RepID=UPI0011997267|nr:TRAP transporter large permease subunit [Aminobacter sp. J44]TWG49530.1 tripartite ATP-independent transporter DctM subunit [Aminobacter sp. J44]